MATISIFAKRQSGEALATARKLRERFSSHRWVAERFLAEALGWEVEPDVRKVAAAGDVVVSLGGDGTLIRVAGLVGAR